MAKQMPPVHPGEILLEEFLKPLQMSHYRLAKEIHVPIRRVTEITAGKRAITPETALRLGRFFNMSGQFWLNLQARYDLEVAEDRVDEAEILRIRPLERKQAA